MPRSILLVEDVEMHAGLIRQTVQKMAKTDVVDSLEDVRKKVRGKDSYGCVILDLKIYEHTVDGRLKSFPDEVADLECGIAALEHVLRYMDASQVLIFTAYTGQVLGRLETLGVLERCIPKGTSSQRLIERIEEMLKG